MCCVSDLVCSSVSCVLLVWSGVVCSCVSSVVFPGVSYALMTWLGNLSLVASFSGNRLALLVCWWSVPAAVSLPGWEPVLSQYHWNPHLSAFGLVALHLFRVPTARPGRPRINLLRPARPLRHWNKWQWPSLDLRGSDALENSVTHPAGSRRRMTPARWIVFAVDLHLGRLLPASGPGPLRQAQGYNRERAIARWGHLNHVRSA